MSVGLVLVTHPGIGSALLQVASAVCGPDLAQAAVVEVALDADLDHAGAQTRAAIAQVDSGSGVLLLTDLSGATPHNVASAAGGPNTLLVSGLNLPMLLRALNYAQRSLGELAERARVGGCRGIAADAIAQDAIAQDDPQ